MSTPTVRVSLPLEDLAPPFLDLLEDVGQLIAQENRNDCRRSFVRTEAMIVAGGRDHRAQERAPSMHRTDHGRAENQELRIGVRIVARVEQIALGRIADREVDVLARAVDPGKRLFVQQTSHAVFFGHALERDHHQLLMVGREVRMLKDRRDFVLAGRDFVVPRLGRNAELEQFPLRIDHEGQHPLRDGAEVVILEFLSLGRGRAEQRPAGAQQIGPREIEVAIDQEILLLGARVGNHRSRSSRGQTASALASHAC